MSGPGPRKTTQQLRAVARIPARSTGGDPVQNTPPARLRTAGRLGGALARVVSAGGWRMTPERTLRAVVGRRPTEPRVVAFVSTKGGVGTTCTAAGVALALAELWPLKVALADVRTGTASLGQLLSGAPVQDAATFVAGIVELTRPAGLTIVDSTPWDTPLSRPTLVRLVTGLRERHLFTVLDVGHGATEVERAALARADLVVVVTTAAADAMTGVEHVQKHLSGLHGADARPTAVAVVAARGLGRHRPRQLTRPLRHDKSVRVPWDSAFNLAKPLEIEGLRRGTRLAYLRLAALCAAAVD
jgi:MinD-like ATPase involved in chromosome partitioning or flagellar assembly